MYRKFLNLVGKYNRSTTAIIVILLIAAAYIYRHHTHSSLADNLYAGAIEVAITVLLIQTILDLERKHRLSLVNASSASNLRVMSAMFALQVLLEMGFKIENELDTVRHTTNEQLGVIQKQFFISPEYQAYLQGLSKVSPNTKKSLSRLAKLLEDWSSMIDKSLRDVRPYPKPELATLCNEMSTHAAAFGLVIDELYSKLPAEITKKYKKGSKQYGEAESITGWLWESFALGLHDSSRGLNAMIREILDANLVIHKAAENNGLYIDL